MLKRPLICLGICSAALFLTGCGKKEGEPAATDAGTAATTAPTDAGTAAAGSWTPEALEELLAPIALYPDVVLGQVRQLGCRGDPVAVALAQPVGECAMRFDEIGQHIRRGQ